MPQDTSSIQASLGKPSIVLQRSICSRLYGGEFQKAREDVIPARVGTSSLLVSVLLYGVKS